MKLFSGVVVKPVIDMSAIESVVDYLDWDKPKWNEKESVHNWRNYAPKELKLIWQDFSDDQKKIITYTLNDIASSEHWD